MTTQQPTNNPLDHAPVDVLDTMEGAGNFLIAKGATPADVVALHEARAAIAELIEAANHAHMALIGYLPAHRNAVTDEAIAKVSAALARVGSHGGAQ